jgi:capsular polysaccharide transport system permease protein
MVGGPSAPSQTDALLVADYLTSHDAVTALQKRLDLVTMFGGSRADPISGLHSTHPAPETLQTYYNRMVDVKINSDGGIATLKVRAFRPADAMAIINQLLLLSEARVNEMNQRNYASSVSMARRQVDEAEQAAASIQAQMTGFRQRQGDFNPQTTGQARVAMVAQLQSRLAEVRAQEAAMAASLSPNSPQLVALRSMVAALSTQVNAENAKLANGPGNVATGLGTYEGLQLRQEFASKQYDAAAASLQKAQEDASKQQLFVLRLVDPNMPVKSLYPKRFRIVVTVFLTLLLTYGIGWLIAAGVREHSV